jgi:hypothetical protein
VNINKIYFCFGGQMSNTVAAHTTNMVSLEEPRSLVQQLVTKFYPENDVAVICNIDRAHAKVIQSRQKELSESHEQLQCTRLHVLLTNSVDQKGGAGQG